MLQLKISIFVIMNISLAIIITSSTLLPYPSVLFGDFGGLNLAVNLGLRWVVHIAKDLADNIKHARSSWHKNEQKPCDGSSVEGMIGNHNEWRH